jgi:hypothetical protein
MCVLEIIPGAFDSYIPPNGINIAWYWDFEGKENENQVIGFFTAQEISVHEFDTHKEGDIKKEVENNRCYHLLRTVPKGQWDTVIPDFTFGGQTLIMPDIHPAFKEEWRPKEKSKIHKNEDGSETIEELQFESEIDQDAFTEINEMRAEKKMKAVKVGPEKLRTVKIEGQKKPMTRVKVDYVKVIDEIKAEK